MARDSRLSVFAYQVQDLFRQWMFHSPMLVSMHLTNSVLCLGCLSYSGPSTCCQVCEHLGLLLPPCCNNVVTNLPRRLICWVQACTLLAMIYKRHHQQSTSCFTCDSIRHLPHLGRVWRNNFGHCIVSWCRHTSNLLHVYRCGVEIQRGTFSVGRCLGKNN